MIVFWATVVGTFAVDRLTKAVALSNLALGERVVVWSGVLEWRMTRNQGMALGFLAGKPVLIMILPMLTMLLGWLLIRRYRTTAFSRFALAMVVGGFLGNFVDRLTVGYVPDMVYFPWMPWYICNVADIAISIGVALLVISLLFRPNDWLLRQEGAHDESHADRRV